jgi:hypothetical protein
MLSQRLAVWSNPKGYYPYVPGCGSSWRTVPALPVETK